MKILTTALLVLLLLAGGAAGAGDRPLLGKLDAEIADLAAQAEAALVSLYFPDPGPWRRATWGVLVGEPPVIVTTAGGTGTAPRLEFQLGDGTEGTAQVRVRDDDLGIAVFALPPEVAAGRKGLEIEEGAVAPGRLGIIPAGGSAGVVPLLDLSWVRGVREITGRLYVRRPEGPVRAGLPFVGADGRLLGIAEAPPPRPAPDTRAAALAALGVLGEKDRSAEYRKDAIDLVRRLTPPSKDLLALVPGESLRASDGAFLLGSTVARVVADLRAHGRVRHSYLGVVLGQTYGAGEARGVLVSAVLDGSPAAAAGITPGSVLTALDGNRMVAPTVLSRALLLKRPGEKVELEFVGTERAFEIILGDRAEAERRLVSPKTLGIDCVPLGAELRSFLGLADGAGGVVVRHVEQKGAAARAGVRRGDLIESAAGEPVADLEELRAAVAGAAGKIALGIRRGAETLTVEVPFPPPVGRQRAR